METEILQRLHDSEINVSIIAMGGEGIEIDLYCGTDYYEVIWTSNYERGLMKVVESVLKRFPESKFAKWWTKPAYDREAAIAYFAHSMKNNEEKGK